MKQVVVHVIGTIQFKDMIFSISYIEAIREHSLGGAH